jgi:alpha-galactosidase/6-phospho-beta-glucosidase family protein
MVDGKDGYPLLRKIIKESKEKIIDDITSSYGNTDIPYNLMETFGYYGVCPIHTQLYYEKDVCLEKHKDFNNLFYNGAICWNKEREQQIKRISEGADYDPAPWGDSKDYCFQLSTPRQLIGIMASIITNDGREWGGINYPNTGVITNLPQDSIVEGPCIINAMGSNPVPIGRLPKPFVGLSLHLINWAELTVEAALSGDKKLLYQAILANPLVTEMGRAKEVMKKMLEINSKFLPQYKV